MRLLFFVVFMAVSFHAAAEQWLCVTERMIGFVLEEKTRHWEPTAFSDKPKYIISTSQVGGSSNYIVKQHGSEHEFPPCSYYVNEQDEYFINCKDKFGSSFLFNKNGKRFQYTDVVGGFIYPYLKNKSPYMAIGLCSAF
jgi:hypothetical protein